MAKAERPWLERVDDAILVQCSQLSGLRDQSLKASIADFRQTSVENRDLSTDVTGRHLGDHDLWALRIERCNMMLDDPDDAGLRRRAKEALNREYG